MTHTMIPGPITSWSKSLLRYKTRSMVMDAAAADKTSLMKEKKDGPSRAMLKSMLKSILLSVLHVYDLWALRHDLLVIPRNRG
jgi:hypothetical protein